MSISHYTRFEDPELTFYAVYFIRSPRLCEMAFLRLQLM